MRRHRPELDVRLASVELVPPDVATALAGIPAGRRVVLVPLLLSPGYHDRVDIPAAVRATRPDAVQAPVLGPDPLLAEALADRLVDAGWRPGEAVVLAAAGSSDPDATSAARTQAAMLSLELTRRAGPAAAPEAAALETAAAETAAPVIAGPVPAAPVTTAFATAATPDVPSAVAAARSAGSGRVAIAPYLLAPGHFGDRLVDAGADVVAMPLGAHPAIVTLALRRYEEASTNG